MKIVLLGANGQLGWELQRSLALLGELVALQRRAQANPPGLCGDLLELDALRTTLRQLQPQAIVNAAAWTAVDQAEAEPALAHAVNATAPAALAELASELGAWLVHYSTDQVFDGSGERPWQEDDACAPLNVYGHSKRAGELAVARCPRHLLLRTSWLHGAHGENFATAMLRKASGSAPLRVVDDQFGAPTPAALLADVTAHALAAARSRPHLAGIYHCAAAGCTSWYDYACFVLEQARALGASGLRAPQTVQPVRSADYPVAARRPRNARLATGRLQAAFGLQLAHWQQGVTRTVQELCRPSRWPGAVR